HQSIGAGRALEAALLDEVTDDLLDEERVALGPLDDQLDQSVERGIRANQLSEQLTDGGLAEWAQSDLPVIGAGHPRRLVVGPEVDQHQPARARHRLEVALQKRLTRWIDPVQILEQRQGRLARALRPHETADQPSQPPLTRLGIHSLDWTIRIGDR